MLASSAAWVGSLRGGLDDERGAYEARPKGSDGVTLITDADAAPRVHVLALQRDEANFRARASTEASGGGLPCSTQLLATTVTSGAGTGMMSTSYSFNPSGRDVSRELSAKQLEAKRDW